MTVARMRAAVAGMRDAVDELDERQRRGRSPWGRLYRRDHVLVLGAPGSGKSPFAAALVRDAARVVYFDAAGDWASEGRRVLARELTSAELGRRFLRAVVDPGEDLVGDFLATVAACRAAAPFGGLVLLVDEVGDLAAEHAAMLELRALHRNGHKDGVASVMCSPSWNDFPARCRATATRVYSFFQRSATDVRDLNLELGEEFGTRANRWRFPAPPVTWVSPTLHP